MLLPRDLPLLLFLGTVSGFRPNHESGGISPDDFTDKSITEMGVLRAVAWYMERHPIPGKPMMRPGELENMKPLTATKLFKGYYKEDVSPARFLKALQEIIDGNNQVEVHHAGDSSYFFHCEEITKSVAQLRALRKSMLSSLKKNALEAARISAGKALHVLQKFYSNTNWVELGETEPYEFLINEESDAYPIASPSEATCDDCFTQILGRYSCRDNILVHNQLTSGYKITATCKSKPRGKCGHGGKDDVTQNQPPTGGINKETSSALFSPHHYLHQKAAELAILATRNFFVSDEASLLYQLEDRKMFQRFFSLEGYSLTFSIDTTGSMNDDIEAVKTTCLNIIKKHESTPDKPFNYILVPFNDPDVGPSQLTNNTDEFKSYISALKVSGGDDCPEMSLSGLKLAVQESLLRSQIYIFTDASAKDESIKNEVMLLLKEKSSVANFILTGECSRRKRRSTASGRRYANVYEELAAYSGGQYVKTTKNELHKVLGILELSLNAAPVKVARGRLHGTRFTFPVDETLKEITVSVKSLGFYGFRVTVLQPSGAPPTSAYSLVNTVNHKVVKVPSIEERGEWSVSLSPSGSYEVEIGGKSLLDFSYQIMQKQKEYMLPVQGQPVKGTNYTVSMRLMGDAEGAQIQRLVSVSGTGTPIESLSLNQTSDAIGNVLAVTSVPFSAPTTLLKMEGLSPENLPFSRISSDPINTESVQILSLPDQKSTVSPGENLDLSVLVVNDGAAASFSFNVWDDLGLLRGFTPTRSYLNPGGNITLTATFVAAADNSNFTSSIATFTAKSSAAQNYLKLPITMVPETATDKIPPVYTIIESRWPCIGDILKEPSCSRSTWRMTFSAKDEHSAVTIQTNTNPTGLSCTPLEDDDREVICDYKSNCCSPSAEFLISDENGNTNTFTIPQPR
ncbi:von Willebrand factor A domain-containing protein 7-like [Hemicordylus capensis]|uniref:von Willebrand factor A domain-containing protein 7-like n=1 Tax=Hemicordylus capensis TaxID=884348 RepID=UPI002302B411|nr:von Willebrand factor A domain-containing protein 7-like [Hemicordylus capensis]